MDADAARRSAKSWLDLWIGIEVGVIGALITLAWFALISPVLGQPWWFFINLFASQFYSVPEVRSGGGIITGVGGALHVVTSGMVGGINGLLTPGGRLFGLGVAILWYLVCYFFLWKRMAPMLPVYAPQPVLIAGWFLFGSALGWHPWFMARAWAPTEPPSPVG